MPKAEILTIGSELIEGMRTDTNATWLARELTDIGIQVTRITSVGDIVKDIIDALKDSLARGPDVIVITGGLGPTPDDKTCDALSSAFGLQSILDAKALELVKLSLERMHARGQIKCKELNRAREKMARIPIGATPLPNPVGVAPGIRLKHGKTAIICLPGVPAEMKAIFRVLRHDLVQMGGMPTHRVMINLRGVGESTVAPLLEQLAQKFERVDVRSYPSGRGAKSFIKIMMVAPTMDEARAARDSFKRSLSELHRSKERP